MRLLATLILLVPMLGALAMGLVLAAGCMERPKASAVPSETAVPSPVPPNPVIPTPVTPVPTPTLSSSTATPEAEGFELELVIDPPGSGFVAALPPFGPYAPGTTVTLGVIRPRIPPYVFSHWAGDAEGSERAVHVVMDGPKRVVARFINPYITPTPSAEE